MVAQRVFEAWLDRAGAGALAFGLVCAATARAQAPFTVSGAGSPIPASGSGGGGVWPTTLPSTPGLVPLTAPVPADACVITEVRIFGLTHTWIGDLQIVLVSPSGRYTNLVVRPGYTGAGAGLGSDGDCNGGTYSIVDANTSGAATVPSVGAWTPGTYQQSFGAWPTGSSSIYDTPLSNLTAEPGIWSLEIFDWSASETGAFTGWELSGTRGLPVTLTGPGGLIPTSGTGGGTVWPGTFPPSPQISLNEYAPPGFLRVESVDINGLAHTWCGDLQMVLLRPDGLGCNLVQRPGFAGVGAGNSGDCDGGNYTIVAPNTGGAGAVPTSGAWNGGTYWQSFGTGGGLWPDGTLNVYNEPLTRLRGMSGRWSLAIYDWAGGDIGSFTSWAVHGYFVPTGPLYVPACPGGVTSNGCSAAMSATTMPSITNATPCLFQASGVEGGRNGLVLYGIHGDFGVPFGNSTLCVAPPLQRTSLQSSGGVAGACNGVLQLDWNAYRLAHPFALGQPFHVGSTLTVQAWFRDPPALHASNLSSAVMVTHLP